ncbi:MAG: SRPBCC family protein [Solirubrobacterales bacterium]
MEVEIEGSPEDVWQAVATGNGIEAWFVPTEVGEQAGGEMMMKLGPDLDAPARILTWDPPHRFVYEEDLGDEETGPQMLLSEWTVEAVGGGHTVMRMVCSGQLDGDDWDEFFESVSGGWSSFFVNLKLYVERFAGLEANTVLIDVQMGDSEVDAYLAVDGILGIDGLNVGDPVSFSIPGVEPVSGEVLRTKENELSLVVDSPEPGQMEFSAFSGGGDRRFRFHWRIYGEGGSALAAESRDPWVRWLTELLPGAKVVSV